MTIAELLLTIIKVCAMYSAPAWFVHDTDYPHSGTGRGGVVFFLRPHRQIIEYYLMFGRSSLLSYPFHFAILRFPILLPYITVLLLAASLNEV